MSYTDQKISELKDDLTSRHLSHEEIFQKHIVDGDTYFFQSVLGDKSKEYQVKSLIAGYLGVHIHEVIFVGSAKLGYSLNPKNLYREFDSKFRSTRLTKDKSDLDIAVVSNSLFNSISHSIFEYTDAFRDKWTQNEYYFGGKEDAFGVPICFKYFEYFSKGWFRPDMKPKGYEFCITKTFEQMKKELFDNFRRKTGLGIYQDWYFFKNYHINNLKALSYRVETEII
ncbi:MAG: hypothetical protein RIG68_17885 [Imperialibacter sp.]|uniref:hypothetical protein n=1 Tax=Imperialibacter sp. TaxID=2038411 RepID=UPI0032F077E5